MNSQKIKNKKRNKKNNLLAFLEDRKFPLLLVGLILILGVIIYWRFLTLESFFIYTATAGVRDTLYGYWPIMHYISQLLHDGTGIPGWTFSMGIGANIFALKKAFLDPFQWLLYIGKPETIPALLGYLQLLKVTLAGLAFYWYTGLFRLQKFPRLMGGILYAFCGYMMLWGQHYQFASFVVTVPLFYGSVELLIQKRNWILFPCMVGFLSALNFYSFYMLSTFLALYMLGRLFYRGNLVEGIKNILLAIGLFVAGLGLGAIFSLPYLHILTDSARIGRALNFTDQFLFYQSSVYEFIWLRMYGNVIPFSGREYLNSLFGTFGIQLFAGLLIPMLISQTLTLPKPQKKWFIRFIIWFLILTHIAFFSYWFDQKAKDSRWIIVLIMCVIAVATKGMDQIYQKGANQKYLLGGLLWSIIPFTFLTLKRLPGYTPMPHDWALWWTIFILIFVYYFLLRNFRPTTLASSILIFFVCLDVGVAGWLSNNYRRTPLTQKSVEKIIQPHHSETAVIKTNDKSKFYRVLHKEPWRDYMTNFHLFRGHKSFTGYTSLHSKSYVEFSRVFGRFFRSQPSWFLHYTFPDHIIQSFLGVKYKVSRHDSLAAWSNTRWKTYGDNSIHINPLVFPVQRNSPQGENR